MSVDESFICERLGWGDGLPTVPPTPERVERMLGDAWERADEVVAVLPPVLGVATLRKVAANAVLAGCLPEYLPVVVAAVRAAAEPAFRLEAVLTTVHSQSPFLLVSGPLAATLGVNGGTGALGAGARANATIGRALLLTLVNVGGARPGGLDAATLGHPGKYSYCFAENRELSPWPELAVERGLAPGRSAVTVYAADAPLCIAHPGADGPEAVLTTVVESVRIPGTYNAFFRDELWLVLSPEHARVCADAGWGRRDVAAWVHRHARLPAARLRGRGLYGFLDDALRPTWLDTAGDDEPIPLVRSPDHVMVTVAGGPAGGYTAVIFGNGRSVTREVEE